MYCIVFSLHSPTHHCSHYTQPSSFSLHPPIIILTTPTHSLFSPHPPSFSLHPPTIVLTTPTNHRSHYTHPPIIVLTTPTHHRSHYTHSPSFSLHPLTIVLTTPIHHRSHYTHPPSFSLHPPIIVLTTPTHHRSHYTHPFTIVLLHPPTYHCFQCLMVYQYFLFCFTGSVSLFVFNAHISSNPPIHSIIERVQKRAEVLLFIIGDVSSSCCLHGEELTQ